MVLLACLTAAWAAAAPLATPQGKVVAVEVPLTAAPGLYFNGEKVSAAAWREHRQALDRLADRFLSGVSPLFRLAPAEQILYGSDDLAYGRVRDGATMIDIPQVRRQELKIFYSVAKPHEGLDVGTRVSADGGRSVRFLGEESVYPLVAAGRIEDNNGDFLSQRMKLEEGGYALVLRIVYGHVAPLRKRVPGFIDAVGVLTGGDKWDSLAKELRGLGPYKGNHVHLLIEGLNDLELLHYAERVRPAPDNADLMDYVKYRADFYNERLLPRLRGSR